MEQSSIQLGQAFFVIGLSIATTCIAEGSLRANREESTTTWSTENPSTRTYLRTLNLSARKSRLLRRKAFLQTRRVRRKRKTALSRLAFRSCRETWCSWRWNPLFWSQYSWLQPCHRWATCFKASLSPDYHLSLSQCFRAWPTED